MQAPTEESTPHATTPTPAAVPAQGMRWLVVDEDPAWRRAAARSLHGGGAAVVDLVGDGLEAIVALSAADYDYVLMGWSMPYMDGVEATLLLRQRGYGARIIGCSHDVSNGRRRAALAAGMDAFLGKPLCAPLLAECIAQLPPRPAARPGTTRLAG